MTWQKRADERNSGTVEVKSHGESEKVIRPEKQYGQRRYSEFNNSSYGIIN